MAIIGKIGRHPDRPERLAAIGLDGKRIATYAVDETLEQIIAGLRERGFDVNAEDNVVRVQT